MKPRQGALARWAALNLLALASAGLLAGLPARADAPPPPAADAPTCTLAAWLAATLPAVGPLSS